MRRFGANADYRKSCCKAKLASLLQEGGGPSFQKKENTIKL